MTGALEDRIAIGLNRPVPPDVAAFAARLASEAGAEAALFYGSNLRTGSLDGVLDFYLLLPGPPERGIWPRVSYHEQPGTAGMLRAKAATMTLEKFAQAASGRLIDTTIWARFVQPGALVWCASDAARGKVGEAMRLAAMTAARLAVALGPPSGSEEEYWHALFAATYAAELRFESGGRAQSILAMNAAHFGGLLPLALGAAGIGFTQEGDAIAPAMPEAERRATLRWWRARRRAGKPLNILRLLRAAFTFEGAARYAAWKIERHTGIPIALTPWRERHPLLAAPVVLAAFWRERQRRAAR